MSTMKTNDNELLASYTKLIDDMLINNQINIDQLPDRIRLSSRFKLNYVRAFRGVRTKSTAEYVRTLKQLDSDLQTLHPVLSPQKKSKYDAFLMYNLEYVHEKFEGITIFDEFVAEQQIKRPLLYQAYFESISSDYK